MLLILFFVAVYTGDVSAHGKPGSGPPAMNKLPAPVVPKPSPPLIMHYKWTPGDVANTFIANGLEAKDIKPLTAEDYSTLPAKAKEASRFIIPSEHAEGCILSFERRDDMNKIADHYRTLNKKDKLYSWTFIKDNVLVVLKGEIPEAKARLYEDALKKLRR
jgi:hypothetical protein